MSAPVRHDTLFRGAHLSVHGNSCCRTDRAISPETAPLRYHEVVFPRRGLWVRHVGRVASVVDPGRIHYFRRGEVHRVSHPLGCGDENLGIVLDDEALARIAPRVLERGAPTLAVAAPARVHAELVALTLAMRASDGEDSLEVEERVLDLARRALGIVDDSTPADLPIKSRRDLAEAARVVLTARYDESFGLDELAAELDTSPFHLSRVFRERYGTSMHEFRSSLRVRAALELLPDRSLALEDIAARTGFGGRSQLSRQLRSATGRTPTEWRRRYEHESSRGARGET